MRIDPTRFESSFRENQVHYLALLAKAARLRAISEGKPFVPPDDVIKGAPVVIKQEQALYESSQAELDNQVGIARQQVTQRRQELIEARARLAQASQALSLANQELNVTRPLLASGAVSEVELLRLERERNNFV